jgi:hypothetical protein
LLQASPNRLLRDGAHLTRTHELGWQALSTETAAVCASHISGKELHPCRDIWKIIDKVLPYCANFQDVGEVAGIDYMVITQSARFQGYKDMDPRLIPQIERLLLGRDMNGISDF